MYAQGTQTAGRRRSSGSYRASYGGSRQKKVPAGQVRSRMVQLVVCLALFLAVYIGKGVFPQRLEQVSRDLMGLMGSNTDFRAAFSRLGESLAQEDSVLGEIGAFCVEVFGAGSVEEGQSPALPVLGGVAVEGRFLSGNPDPMTLASHYIRQEQLAEVWFRAPVTGQAADTDRVETQVVEQVPVLVPPVGTIIEKVAYTGQSLPEGFTMDHLSLGELETATPVFGPIHSAYGYRDHPLSGSFTFHQGIDIGGYKGDPILAFAAGTVEYIGEDSTFGMYLRIDHGNGIKSFYAHCSKLVVKKGQQVAVGEKVAEVGSTGSATGPHLHLELKVGEAHLNPAYYIDYLRQ